MKSYYFKLVNVATGTVVETRLLTHIEASDSNHYYHSTRRDFRWIQCGISSEGWPDTWRWLQSN